MTEGLGLQSSDSEGQLQTVMTVKGPVGLQSLGITLFHEHLFLDNRSAFRPSADPRLQYLKNKKVALEDLAYLREVPYASLDNIFLNEPAVVRAELEDLASEGGQSIVEVTGWNSGRSPDALVRLSEQTGIQIIMGCGLYRERSHPEWVERVDDAEIANRLIDEINRGIQVDEDKVIRPGIIGEIGISKEFTDSERKSLRGACKAQITTGLPLTIHLPGWERHGHEVVDLCFEEGVSAHAIVLSHMDPSSHDPEYQESLAKRGVFVEFDGIGMGLFLYREKQCPSDDQIAAAIIRLVEKGFEEQILLSQDVYLKILWRSYGGNGYGHVLRSFLPRLQNLGLSRELCEMFVVHNPRRVFELSGKTMT